MLQNDGCNDAFFSLERPRRPVRRVPR